MRCHTAALAAVLTLSAAGALAQDPARIKVDAYTLPNGLRVQLVEDHSSQVVAVDLWYDVGARNEVAGRTGFAHLFEHMMFQGSKNLKKVEHSQFIERAGGNDNASTQYDVTNYYQFLPSNRLNLALWLEAERMRGLNVTAEGLKNQVDAVKEERRLRVDNQPYSKAIWEGTLMAFDAKTCFGYAHSLIGSMSDLEAAKVEDVQAFFKMYYAPNNVVLTVVGDLNPADTKALIAQYFGGIPRQPAPPAVTCEQPFNSGAMRRELKDDKATLPAVLSLYRIPPTSHADAPALELLATILGQGESSRLNKVLARETKAALGAQAMVNPFGPRRGPGMFFGLAIANQGVGADSVEKLLVREITQVATTGVSADELTKAKNQYRAGKMNERQRAFALAEAVQFANTYLGSPDAVNTDLDRYAKVTVDDIKRVAATYLKGDNALTITIVPEKK
ncbi:MAG: pitrilysin family protein [Gemmatimonadetes bacterium]|nr:pitrilysin family protein [Gemmatimonadota bacterium]